MLSYDEDLGRWVPKAPGTADLVGTPNDRSGLTPLTLKVTVVQPVERIVLSSSDLYVEVGNDITDRLNALVTVSPSDASNKNYTWTVEDGSTYVTKNGDKLFASEETPDGTGCNVTATADDGYGASNTVTVYVMPEQPKSLEAIEKTLNATFDPNAADGVDVTTQVIGNFKLTPTGNLLDYYPTFTSSNEDAVKVEASATSSDVKFIVVGAGDAIITATIYVQDYSSGTPERKTLTDNFTMKVAQGLGSFTLSNVVMTKDESYNLVLTAQPNGAVFDASKISLTIDGGREFPAGWTFVESAATSTPLNYTLTASSVGTGIIHVLYDGREMGNASIAVQQHMETKAGWQWVSFNEGSVSLANKEESPLGNNLAEARSQTQLVTNDASYGYVGQLTQMTSGETYKLNMKSAVSFNTEGNNYLTDASANPVKRLNKGWNWVGNPYQYYQSLNDALAGSSFTSGDIVKAKDAFATYNGTTWTGSLTYLTPGEGVLVQVQNAGEMAFVSELGMEQQKTAPAGARGAKATSLPFTIDDSRFADNMSMIARLNGSESSHVVVLAFADGECRGRSVEVDGLQFITIHGQAGEQFTLMAYDELTGELCQIEEQQSYASVRGSLKAPVALTATGVVTGISAIDNGQLTIDNSVYDLQGSRVNVQSSMFNVQSAKKGIYVNNGRKVVVR